MKMPEASVILSGRVFIVTPTQDFESKTEDGGAKIAVLGGGGATEVKLKPEEYRQLAPVVGDEIAWHVEPFLWTMNGNSGVSFLYRAVADIGSVSVLHEIVSQHDAKASAKS